MILGLGIDLCPPSRWRHLVERFGAEKCAGRILHPEEAAYLLGGNRERLPERLAGRWALGRPSARPWARDSPAFASATYRS